MNTFLMILVLCVEAFIINRNDIIVPETQRKNYFQFSNLMGFALKNIMCIYNVITIVGFQKIHTFNRSTHTKSSKETNKN